MTNKKISAIEAFITADDVLRAGVQGISDLIVIPGLINLDFNDVKSVMQGAGSALMGIGTAKGEDRAVRAAEIAVSSPLLEATIEGAHGVLLLVQGASDLGLHEIDDAARLVQEAVHPEANIIFGAVIDDTLGDEVRVTVIAAGFDGGEPTKKRFVGVQQPAESFGDEAARDLSATPGRSTFDDDPFITSSSNLFSDDDYASVLNAPAAPSYVSVDASFVEDDGGDLDVPDFIK
jgi:cell division protein FtsZ